MPSSFDAQPSDILNLAEGHMQSVQAKWGRLTQDDLTEIHTKGDLAARVEQRYSLPHELAVKDVEIWAGERQFARWTF